MGNQLLAGKKILVTAGPTREPIDAVRYVSSSTGGRMGYDIAENLLQQGATVYLVSGPVKIDLIHPMLTVVKVHTAYEMYLACCKFFEEADISIFAAAVPDYRPKEVRQCFGEGDVCFSVKMVKNIDIPAAFANVKKPDQFMVSFVSQTNKDIKKAINRMDRANLDMLVLNTVYDTDIAFGVDNIKQTTISIIRNDYTVYNLSATSRSRVTKEIIAAINETVEKGKDLVSHRPSSVWQNLAFEAN